MDRYFVVITVPDPSMVPGLRDRGLDLFPAAGAGVGRPSVLEGLLTMAQVTGLREAGYQVTVSDPAEARARARQTASFEAWRQAVEQ
jgi:hypothetical protein